MPNRPPSTALQVWTSGVCKDGSTFNPLKGDEPSPIELLPDCCATPCVADVPFAPENLTMDVWFDWIVDRDHLRIRIKAPSTNTHETPLYEAALPDPTFWYGYSKHFEPGIISLGGCLQGEHCTTDYNYGLLIISDDAPANPVITHYAPPNHASLTTLHVGTQIFSDRPYLTNYVRASLVGAYFLQTPNDDRFRTDNQICAIRVAAPCTVFAMFAGLDGEPPWWCNGEDWLPGDLRTYIWHRVPEWTSRERIEGERKDIYGNSKDYIECRDIVCDTIATTFHPELAHLPYPAVWVLFLTNHGPGQYEWTCSLYWSPQIDGDPCGTYIRFRTWTNRPNRPMPEDLEVTALDKGKPAPRPCPTERSFIIEHLFVSAYWFDWDERVDYIGACWDFGPRTHAEVIEDASYTGLYCAISDITCVPDDAIAGEWRFTLDVYRDGLHYDLTYHRPTLGKALGIVGQYRLYDPAGDFPWATPIVFVYDRFMEWPEPPLPLSVRIAKEVAIYIALAIIGHAVSRYLAKARSCLSGKMTYDAALMRKAAVDAKIVLERSRSFHGGCTTIMLQTSKGVEEWKMSKAVWDIIRLKGPFPAP